MSETKLPTRRDITFLLAEDMRQEGMGKISLLGYIAGDRFSVAGEVSPKPENAAFVLPSIAFVFVIKGGEGKFKGRVRVVAPDRTTVVFDIPFKKPLEKRKDKPAMFGTGSKPFAGPSFGTYTVEFTLEKSKFKFPVDIERGSLSEATDET